ncbi:MAG: hypothetical protein IKP06_07255 [Elusimicrobiaceae bacterium]|nr:hypothetical protein [Elusimicrobiaceae bacterium]
MNTLISTPPLNVFEHMALDEHLVHVWPGAVILRFYNWTPGAAVTFGYAQFISEVRRALNGQGFSGSYARRPTGGGVVFHTDDLTFSLVFTSLAKPAEIYKNLHSAIFAQLQKSGFGGEVFGKILPAAEYAPSINHEANACFIRPVENDLLAADGQKMLGGAIRRFGQTVLYQGSLQQPGARTNPLFKRAVIEGVRQFLAVDLHPMACAPEDLTAAKELARTQYNTFGWTEKF